MLQIIRDRMSGPLVWGIIGFLVLLFAVWGIGAQSFLGGGGAQVLAKVGSTTITQPQFQDAFNRSYQRLTQQAGSNFDPSEINLSALRKDVFNGMIRDAVTEQYAVKHGYRVSNRELYDYLRKIPAFQVNGSFSAKTYRKVLARNGLAPSSFEGHVRNALRSEQLQFAVMGTSFVVPKQAAMSWAIAHQRRDFESVAFDPSTYRSEVHLDAKKVSAYYEQHKDRYFAPEAVRLHYVELNQRDLSPAKPPHQSVLKALYAQQKNNRFRVAAERKASQILIRFDSKPRAARHEIDMIAKQLEHGASFSALAKQYSQDPISSTKGGVVGWIKEGTDSSSFEKSVFSLKKVGQVSPPIKTRVGWHLIRLDGVRPAHTLPFDSPIVQQALIRTYDSQAASRKFHRDQKQLAELAFEHPNSLEPVASALGLQVESTGWLTRDNATDIAKHPKVLAAAFSKGILQDGNNSKPIAIGPGDLVVIRKAGLRLRRQLTLAQVTERIRKKLIGDDAAKDAEKAAQSLVTAVQQGSSFQKAAKAANLTPSVHKSVTRSDTELPKTVVAVAFGLPKPVNDRASVGLARLPDGRISVVALTAVHDSVLKADSGSVPGYPAFAEKLNSRRANLEFDNYWNFMATQVGIEVKKGPGSLAGSTQQ